MREAYGLLLFISAIPWIRVLPLGDGDEVGRDGRVFEVMDESEYPVNSSSFPITSRFRTTIILSLHISRL